MPSPDVNIVVTIQLTQVWRVPRLYGVISIMRDSSFLSRLSPSSVFSMSHIVASDMISATMPTALATSGESMSLEYPGTVRSESVSASVIHRVPVDSGASRERGTGLTRNQSPSF